MGERSIEKFLRTNLPAISFFRKVAIVEEFYGIIKCAHVDDKGVHAGQKKTYRLVSKHLFKQSLHNGKYNSGGKK